MTIVTVIMTIVSPQMPLIMTVVLISMTARMSSMMTGINDINEDINDISMIYRYQWWHQWFIIHRLFVSVELSKAGLVLELHGIIELLSLFLTDNYPALIRRQFWVITEVASHTIRDRSCGNMEGWEVLGQQYICTRAPTLCQIPSFAQSQLLTLWLWRWIGSEHQRWHQTLKSGNKSNSEKLPESFTIQIQ